MKKVILVACLILAVLAFTACQGGGSTVDRSWADNEKLVFSIKDKDKGEAEIGEATFVTTTALTDEEKAATPNANTKVTSTVTINNVTRTTVFYTKIYNVLKMTSVYVDGDNAENNYELSARHEGKNYVYDLKYPSAPAKNKSGKLSVGSSGYTDAEFLYFYVRCYDIGSVPSSVSIPDPFTGTVTKVSCSAQANNIRITTASSLGTVSCDKVEINRANSPVGKGLTVYFVNNTAENAYGEGSMIKSVHMPVQIVENNLVYTLKHFDTIKE